MGAYCNTTLIDEAESKIDTELPLWKEYTFHQLGIAVGSGFGALATVISLWLIFMHATHYSRPAEQKQIIRIIFMIPVYAVTSVLSYLYYRYAIYWEVLRDCYEAFAIASFFTLLCHYVAPTLHEQKDYFRMITPRNWVWPIPWMQKCTGGRDRGPFRVPRSGLTWFNVIWVSVYQYCLIRVSMTFTAMITELLDRYCASSFHPAFAYIWVQTINALAVTVAMYCLIQFYLQLKSELAEHKPFMKVLCIKLVIFFSFWQVWVISLLSAGDKPIINHGPRVTYIDIHVGIPTVLLTIEMAIFAVLHIFAFPYKPYDIRTSSDPNAHYRGGFLGVKAIFDTFNLWDVVKASARGFRWLFVGYRQRHHDPSYKMEAGAATTNKPYKVEQNMSQDAFVNSASGPRRQPTYPPTYPSQNAPTAYVPQHLQESSSEQPTPPIGAAISRGPDDDYFNNDRQHLLNGRSQRRPSDLDFRPAPAYPADAAIGMAMPYGHHPQDENSPYAPVAPSSPGLPPYPTQQGGFALDDNHGQRRG